MTGRRTEFMAFFALVFMSFSFVFVRPDGFISCCFFFIFLLFYPFLFLLFVSFRLFSFRIVPLLLLRRRELTNPLCEGKTVRGNDGQVADRLAAIWFTISYLGNRVSQRRGARK